jgi:hypothetical protein
LKCAQRLDRDAKFRAASPAAFEGYQRSLREFLKENGSPNGETP